MTPLSLFLATLLPGVLLAPQDTGSGSHGSHQHAQVATAQLTFSCRLPSEDGNDIVRQHLQAPSLLMAGDLGQEVALPAPFPAIRLRDFLPLATAVQRLEPVPEGRGEAAVKLSIDGPKLAYERCLVADNPIRNRMSSLIGTWRYITVSGEEQRAALFQQFETELDREPTLSLGDAHGKVQSLQVREGLVHELDEPACKVRIVKFLPHYTRDSVTGQVANLSEKLVNPAVLLEIDGPAGRETRWVFARFPDFVVEGAGTPQLEISLLSPVIKENPAPDFVLVTVDEGKHELWSRIHGEISSGPISLAQKVDVPGSQYSFHIDEYLPSCTLVEEYRPTESRAGAQTALRIETLGEDGETASWWLSMGREYTIATARGPVSVSFGPEQPGQSDGHAHRQPEKEQHGTREAGSAHTPGR